jgi:hypothetical protein
MNTPYTIQVITPLFSISRSEGWGYVENTCEFDKDTFELLDITYVPSPFEGGNCQVTYHFKINQPDKPNSCIVFIEDWGDNKYIADCFIYNNHILKREKN